MSLLCSAIFSIGIGIFCLLNGKTPTLGFIGMAVCFIIAAVDITFGVIEIRNKKKEEKEIRNDNDMED